jgi:predicted amidohydrolase
MNISIIQSGIAWEDKEKNLQDYHRLLSPLQGKTDLAVLPETFTTGFSMRIPHLAESNAWPTIQTLLQWAEEWGFAIAGSFLAKNADGKLFNRGFFITPEGDTYFSDKRHLFFLSEEPELLTPAKNYPIIPYRGWNIRLIICYDLRFPVWIRNREHEYDLLLCVANWPQSRANVWNILLKARAIENVCYVCGVNRTGVDGNGLSHQGDSVLVDYKGNLVLNAGQNSESILTHCIRKEDLDDFRHRFPAGKDADRFIIIEN